MTLKTAANSITSSYLDFFSKPMAIAMRTVSISDDNYENLKKEMDVDMDLVYSNIRSLEEIAMPSAYYVPQGVCNDENGAHSASLGGAGAPKDGRILITTHMNKPWVIAHEMGHAKYNKWNVIRRKASELQTKVIFFSTKLIIGLLALYLMVVGETALSISVVILSQLPLLIEEGMASVFAIQGLKKVGLTENMYSGLWAGWATYLAQAFSKSSVEIVSLYVEAMIIVAIFF